MNRPPEPDVTDLAAVLASCWNLLERGVADRRHGFHHPVVANVSPEGRPRARVVILRHVDRETKSLRFHTDVRARKWDEMKSNSAVGVTLYDEGARVQVKIDGRATLHAGEEIAASAWAASQRMSRMCYATTPAPGSVAAMGDAFALPTDDNDIHMGQANFGVVAIHVEAMEWLYLRAGGHRRAVFDLVRGTAQWLVP